MTDLPLLVWSTALSVPVAAGHLLFADRKGAPPEAYAVRKVVTTVLAAVVREPQP